MKPLKLNGKLLDLNPAPALVNRAIAILKKLPADELITAPELAKKLGSGYSCGSWFVVTSHESVAPFCAKHKNRWLFGSSAAIKELRRRLNEGG